MTTAVCSSQDELIYDDASIVIQSGHVIPEEVTLDLSSDEDGFGIFFFSSFSVYTISLSPAFTSA